MICHDPECAFVHIPKTAGTSLELFFTGYDWVTRSPADYRVYLREKSRFSDTWGGTLCEQDPVYFRRGVAIKHATQGELRVALGHDRWHRYFKFTFVRNPWKRLLSIYDHGRRDAPKRMPSTFAEWIAQREPVDHMGQAVFRRHVDDWDELDFIGRVKLQIQSDTLSRCRTDKDEFYQLLTYRDDVDLVKKLAAWEKFYNYDRPHGAHKGKTPYEALREKLS